MDKFISVRLTLISASPRRQELLRKLGLPFDVSPSHAGERWIADSPAALAELNARRKIEHSQHFDDSARLLLGADTIIAFDSRVFGKPAGSEAAFRMLTALSGRWHDVITGICLRGPGESNERRTNITSSAVSRVRFRELSARDIRTYIQTGEWQGKAGAYAIQDVGSALVAELDGNFENVVGLPTELLHDLVARHFSHCRFR